MEKNEFYVEFDDGTRGSAARGATPGISYLAYSQRGYYLTLCRSDFQYFESEKDAKEACLHLVKDSGGLKGPFSAVTVRKGESTVCHVTKFRALPDGKECPTPRTLADTRNQLAASPNRPADFASHEKEHENMKLPEMEQSLIAEFKARCELGFKQYGPVYLAKRNWGKEMKEEALDGLFYALMAAKSVEKYGVFIQALEQASDDDLSMDACSPDPLKQAAYLVKKYAADLSASENLRDKLHDEWHKEVERYTRLLTDLRQHGKIVEEQRDAAEAKEEAAQKEVAELCKALEDEREAKRIVVRETNEEIANMVAQRNAANDRYIEEHEAACNLRREREAHMTHIARLANENCALKAECGESRKFGAAEFRRAQKAEQERDNCKESCEKLRKENLDMRAAMESALSLGSPRG